jgi:AsmA protein
MSKTVKILGIVVGGILLLAIVAAVAVSALFDPNDYKEEVASQVKTHTGRTVTLDGDLSLSFFPWLGVESGKVTVGNAPGFGDEPFATLDRVDVYVRLMPLLSKRVEARTVVLEGLHLNLARNSAGQTNWDDLVAAKSATPPPAAETPAMNVAVAGLELRDSSLSWRDDRAKSNYLIDNISLETGALELGKPIDLKAALSVAKGLPGYVADLKIGGTVRPDIDKSLYSVDDLKLDYLIKDTKGAELTSGTLTGKVSADVNKSQYDVDDLKLDYLVKDAKGAETARGALTGKISADTAQSIYAFDNVSLKGKIPLPVAGSQPTDVTGSWTTARLNQATQQLAVTGFSVKALDTTATISRLDGTSMFDSPQMTGVIDIPQLSVAKLFTTLGIALPTGMDVNAFGNASLHSDFSVQPSASALRLSGMKGEVLGMQIQGDARSERGKLSGNIIVPPFATAPLFRALGTTLPQDINVKAIDKLGLATGFELDSARGTLALRDLKANLLGTTMTGDVQGANLNGQPRYTGAVHVANVDPAAFVAVFGKLMPTGLDAKELGELALDTRFDSQSAKQLLQLDDLHMTIVGLQFGGNLTLSKFPAATEYNGDLTVEQFSPRALLKRFGGEPPVTADPKALTAASGKAHVSATATSGRFDNVVLNLDQSRITGKFAVDNFNSPGYDFAIAIDDVDVDRYLPPPTEEEKTTKDAQAGDVIIPVATLKTLKLGGKVTAGSMKLGGIRLSQLDATLSAKDSVARLDPVTATLYQGKFAGGFTADARAAPPTINVKGKATGINVGGFLKDLSPDQPVMITGKGSFDLQLTGKGNSYKKNLRSSDGSIGFALTDGALNGFDLGYTLCSAYNTIARLPKPKAKDTKKTPFKSITGTSVVTNGVSSTNDLLGTTAFMKVTGKGNLNLPQQKLDYDMNATMTASTKLAGCMEMDKLIGQSFPLDISGTISEPKVMPDFGKLAKDVLQKKVEDELKDKLLDKLGGKKKPPPKNP